VGCHYATFPIGDMRAFFGGRDWSHNKMLVRPGPGPRVMDVPDLEGLAVGRRNTHRIDKIQTISPDAQAFRAKPVGTNQ
jgi:hypothetical protein